MLVQCNPGCTWGWWAGGQHGHLSSASSLPPASPCFFATFCLSFFLSSLLYHENSAEEGSCSVPQPWSNPKPRQEGRVGRSCVPCTGEKKKRRVKRNFKSSYIMQSPCLATMCAGHPKACGTVDRHRASPESETSTHHPQDLLQLPKSLQQK